MLCLAALAGWSAAANAALPIGLPLAQTDQPSAGQVPEGAEAIEAERSDEAVDDGGQEAGDSDAESESESDSAESSSEDEPAVVETTAAFAGAARLRGLKKLTYVAACPAADCELSLDVELRFPGGRKLTLETPIKSVAAGTLTKLSLRLPRAVRKSLRRAKARGRNVVAVAHVVEWSTEYPEYGEAIRTRLH